MIVCASYLPMQHIMLIDYQ